MIFSETACGLTLPSDKKRLPTLPCSSRFANVCVFSPYQRELDSHMMKNTEWGAVAYLSHSIYGINVK